MSFIVLGVQPGRIDQMVQQRVARQEKRLKRCPTPETSAARAERARLDIQSSPPRRPVSAELSSPSIALDFARLAVQQGIEHVQIARRVESIDGKPRWQPAEVQP